MVERSAEKGKSLIQMEIIVDTVISRFDDMSKNSQEVLRLKNA